MRTRPGILSVLSSIVAVALMATGLTVALASPAAAAASLGLAKNGPETVLVGGGGEFELTVTNGGDAPAYNVSFRDVLPAGVTYTSGSTTPTTLGEPTVIANKPATGQTTLIWDNVFDLNPSGRATLAYAVTTSSVRLPVGAVFTNTATPYWSSDVRVAPRFDANGVFTPEPQASVTVGTSVPEATTVTALEVEKSEPSSENELVRGIHGSNGTTYTIRVTNNGIAFTNGVTVTDHLPASLEFLQCGGADNTNGSFVEYPTAPRLTSTTAPSGTCPTPTSVETVTDPAGLAPGIYTKVTWSVGNLPPGGSSSINYRAGIPLQQNAATFVERPGDGVLSPSSACAAGVCPQAANLDNNTGASTVETITEASATNYAEAAGSYQGNGVDGAGSTVTGPLAVTAQDTETVTVEDLTMVKTVSPTTFTQGGTATYRITLRTSEYRSGSTIAVTDVLPDGLTYVAGSVSGAAFVSSTGTGPTTLRFSVADIGAAATFSFTYRATMQAAYSTSGRPTVAGDSFANAASLTALTTGIPGLPAPEPTDTVSVTDTSSATITSGGSTINKRIGQNRANPACATNTYAETPPSQTFQLGDIVCFELRVDFNDGVSTRNAFAQDFLPAGLAYETGSWEVASGGTVAADEIEFSSAGGGLIWLIGTPQGGVDRYVDKAEVFLVRFAARVIEDEVGTAGDVTGNLMKTGSLNTAGQATTGRDDAQLTLAGSQVTIRKGVSQIAASTGTTNYNPPRDGLSVKGGDLVTFRIDIANVGTVPVRNLSITDDLRDGIACADVSGVSDAGSCSGSSLPSGVTGRLSWAVDDDVALAPGATRSFTYVVTIPSTVLVNTTYNDTGIVGAYESQSNLDQWLTVLPQNLKDPSSVKTPNVALAKSGQTGFVDVPNNNNQANQFTEGETVSYTVDVRVPSGTTVASNSTLTDHLPAELILLGTPAPAVQFSATNNPANLGPAPSGTQLLTDVLSSRDRLRVVLPAGYSVPATSTTSHLFRLTFTALLNPARITEGDHGKVIRNTASFTGAGSKSYDAFVVLPNPLLSKTNNRPNPVQAVVDPIQYTLTLTNPAGSAALKHTALYGSTVTDVIPDGLIVDTGSFAGASCTVNGATGTGGGTITCNVGTLDSNETATITYTASIVAGALGSQAYVNTATLAGKVLPTATQPNPDNQVTYTRSANSVVGTDDGILTKSVSPAVATIGQVTTWTVTWETGNLSYVNPRLVDTLPAVGSAQALTTVTPSAVSGWTPSASAGQVTWDFVGTIPAQSTVTFTYTAVVANVGGLVAGDVLVNSARVNAGPSAEAALEVVEPALFIQKSVGEASPVPGEPIEYTVKVTNEENAPGESGPVSTAYNATVTDVVPAGIIVDTSTLGINGSCTVTCDQVNGGGTITWTSLPALAPGESLTRTYTATLKASIIDGEYINVASVPSYTSCDSGLSNPIACSGDGRQYGPIDDSTTVMPGEPRADLAIVKTPSGSTTPGSGWTFTMQVSNLGPSDAVGAIVVTDTLPDGLTYVSSGADWDCLVGGQTITCTLEPISPEPAGLPAGEDAAPLQITVRTASTPTNASYTNVAAVESTTTVDPNLVNNTSSATVTVAPIPIPPPPDPDPEKPVDPQVPVDPDKPVDPDPEKPVDPQVPVDPDKPVVSVQKPTEPLPVPDRIRPGRPTVVLPAGVVTNAGQPVTATVKCRPLRMEMAKATVTFSGQVVPMGQVSYCKVTRRKNGKVIVTVTYPGPVLVKVVYSAPKVPGYTAFKQVKRYVVTPR